MSDNLLHNIRREGDQFVTECPRCTHPTRDSNKRAVKQAASRHVERCHPGGRATFQ